LLLANGFTQSDLSKKSKKSLTFAVYGKNLRNREISVSFRKNNTVEYFVREYPESEGWSTHTYSIDDKLVGIIENHMRWVHT
jgi:hypothetical protein